MLRARVKTRQFWEILLRRNMTQNELARKAGIAGGHLSQLINGERYPTPGIRKKLLAALRPIDFDDIFEIEEHPRGRAEGRPRKAAKRA